MAMRFWRRTWEMQISWPNYFVRRRQGYAFLVGAIGWFLIDTQTPALGQLGLIIRVHLFTPFLILQFMPVFLFAKGIALNFKLTEPLVHGVESIPRLLRQVLGLKRTSVAPGSIAIGEHAGDQGLFQDPRFYLTEDNLNYHLQVIGGSGAGKSNFLQLLIEDRIAKGHGLIFVDLKADFETVDWLTRVAAACSRAGDLRVFSLTDREISVGYNPLASGTLNEIHSRIMQSLNWSEEYYRKAASSALSDVLMGLCEVRNRTNEQFSLNHIFQLLSAPEVLDGFLLRPELTQSVRETLKQRAEKLRSRDGAREIMGLLNDLQGLIRSSAGELLIDSANGNIDLMEAIQNRQVVYLLMNSMQDKESSVAIGKLFLQDLISTVGRIYREVPEAQRQPVTLIVDEFASFATENFIDLINRARGAKMGIVVAHQSRGDLKSVSDNFCDQLERNANTKVIFGTDNSEDAEYFASMVGTISSWKETIQVQENLFWHDQGTGMKSLREVEEFLVHPNEIKRLGQGQAFIVKRQRDRGFGLVNLYPASAPGLQDEFISSDSTLRKIRDSVAREKQTKFIELPSIARVESTESTNHGSKRQATARPTRTARPSPASDEAFT